MIDPTIDQLVGALQPLTARCNTSTFWELFPGATKVFRNKGGGALTAAMVRGHLLGGKYPRIGLAHIIPGTAVTRVAVLDLDSHPRGTRKGVDWPTMVATAQRIQDALLARGQRVTPFRSSGGAGVHLYLMWDDPQDAYSVRELLADALADCDLSSGTKGLAYGEVEVFPKQDHVPVGDYGNMVWLPLAKESVPLDYTTLDPLPRYPVLWHWQLSPPVPVREKPAGIVATVARPLHELVGEDSALAQVAAALSAIPNDGLAELDYDQWFSAMAGTHNATGGGDAGLALFQEFSARSGKYNAELTAYKWASLHEERPGGGKLATADTLFAMARPFGFMLDITDRFRELAEQDAAGAAQCEIEEPLPALERDKKGRAEPTLPNVRAALGDYRLCGARVMFDAFGQQVMISYERDGGQPRNFQDEDYTDLQIHLERISPARFKPIGERTLVRGVAREAWSRRFDSARDWLDSLEWDGIRRVETFAPRCWRTEDVPYTRALGRYLWTGLAGRVLDPGCQADAAPVLIGDENLGKSRGIRALVPDPRFYCELDLHDTEAETGRKLRGKLIGEIAEMRGLDTKDREAILKMMSRSVDEWVPKYVEFARSAPRRALFLGTCNYNYFLKGEPGERRWLPVEVGQIDLAGIAQERLQLWAEGAELFREQGVMWQEITELAIDYRRRFTRGNEVEGAVEDWLDLPDLDGVPPREREYVVLSDLLAGVYGRRRADIKAFEQTAVVNALHRLGWRSNPNDRPLVEGRRLRVWRLNPALAP